MTEEYVPLPLKWRPRTWDDLVGQKHAVAVLKSSIKRDRVFSCYIFAGTAGSGKTSAARIFAMALNCQNRGDSSSPCLECISCTEALKFRNPDIMEMDGPSHGSVAHVRELRSQAVYSPFHTRKVFIIDEAHSLSRDAFEALLKLLEEPPRYVVFMLATTNPERIPATIHSRSIKLDFRRHTEQDVVERLSYVARIESLPLPEEAAILIARYADGSLRDSLTVLDQLATSNPKHALGVELVTKTLGIVSGTELHSIMDSVLRRDAKGLETALNVTLERTTEFGMIVREITDWYLSVLRVKAGATAAVRRSHSDLELLTSFAEHLEYPMISEAVRICWELSDRVRAASNNPRTFFITGLYRLMLLTETPPKLPIGPPPQVKESIVTAPTTPAPAPFTSTVSTDDLERELRELTSK